MREAVKALLFGGHKIEDRAPAPNFGQGNGDYAVQLRLKLTHARTMAHAEQDVEMLLRDIDLTIGAVLVESEIYEY